MSNTSIQNVCEMMAGAIRFIKREIESKEARIRALTERLKKLQSQPNPDPSQIQETTADIQELEEQLETTDRPQLNAFEEEFAASCG